MTETDGTTYFSIMPCKRDAIPLYTHPAKTLTDEPNWKEMYWEMHELNHKHWSELKAHSTQKIKNLKDGELPVLTVTVLDCNGKLVRSVVSFKETRIICDSLVDELRKVNSK